MKSARARPTAKKRAFLECFMCWILLCCFPGSIRGYKNDEVGHHGALEERNAEMCFCCQVSPYIYTQRVTPALCSPLAQARTPRHVRKAYHAAGRHRSLDWARESP